MRQVEAPFMASEGAGALTEGVIVERLRQGDRHAAALVMRRYNRTLWRVARGILRHDADAEDAVQEAYLRAFSRIGEFRGDSSLGTWLGRIVANEALRRLERRRAATEFFAAAPKDDDALHEVPDPTPSHTPEHLAARREIRGMVERAVDRLPAPFRMVFILRIVEQMSILETADMLGIPAATAKTRLHRAIAQLRRALGEELAATFDDAFPFGGSRCDRLTEAVMHRLGAEAEAIGGNLSGSAMVQYAATAR